jgi:hypothetical protein
MAAVAVFGPHTAVGDALILMGPLVNARRSVALGAVTTAAVLVLAGCNKAMPPAVAPLPSSTTAVQTSLNAAPLPPVDALTGVLYRIADPSVPPEQKAGLIEHATPEDQAMLATFTKALADNGFIPLNVTATDLAWSANHPGNVLATITLSSVTTPANKFTYPMEFSPLGTTWQLNRQTANLLLSPGKPGGAPGSGPAPAQPPPAPPTTGH